MKNIGWLIYNNEDRIRNQSYIDWMLEEAKGLDMDLRLMLKEKFIFGVKENKLIILYENKNVEMPDYTIFRNIDSIFTKQLELLGVKVFNNSFISDTCNHKAKTHQYLAQFNIPMMDTYFFKKDEFVPENLNLEYPLVIKEVDGRGGKQVYKAETLEDLKNLIANLNCRDIIVQPLGEVPGRDVRVFVVGKHIVASILRSSEVDFRANFSLGGSAGMYELTEKQEKLVYEIIDKFDLGLAGIDFIFNKNDDFLFNEIEDVVGSRTLSQNSDINIVKIYLEHIKKQLQKQ